MSSSALLHPEATSVLQMAEALQHLHALGIAHMDVKPDNIFTTGAGAYKLGDFGLARPLGQCQEAMQLEEGDSRCVLVMNVFCVSDCTESGDVALSQCPCLDSC